MDAEERARFEAWFAEKWHHGPCPVCAANEWGAQPKLGQIENLGLGLEASDRPMVLIQGGRVPILLISCKNCGYTVAVNAIIAGIRQPPRNARD
jgi:hypothetical protein